jgi:RHS repeat-associated protein
MVRGNAAYYYISEMPGHVSGLLNSAGGLVNQYRYGPWGEAQYVQESVPNPFRYTARQLDSETGLYHYRARYYDPELGRFISEDPIGLAGGINPYAYVGNDPVNTVDPSGLHQCERDVLGACKLRGPYDDEMAIIRIRLRQINDSLPICTGARQMLTQYVGTPEGIRVWEGEDYQYDRPLGQPGRRRLRKPNGEFLVQEG